MAEQAGLPLELRKCIEPLLPAPDSVGCWTDCPISSSEAKPWMHGVLSEMDGFCGKDLVEGDFFVLDEQVGTERNNKSILDTMLSKAWRLLRRTAETFKLPPSDSSIIFWMGYAEAPSCQMQPVQG